MNQAKPHAKTAAERQADLRRRRLEQGREQTVFWLSADEKLRVKAFLAGKLDEDSAKLERERDSLTAKLEKSRAVINEIYVEQSNLRNEIGVLQETTRYLQRQLAQAEKALKEKPAKTFKVSALPDRSSLIFSSLCFEKGWKGIDQELDTARLNTKADLAKKLATEIKQARSRVASLVSITTGEKMFELSKSQARLEGWKKFESPIISPAEKALLEESCVVMARVERDIEQATGEVAKLHNKRELEDKARRKAASSALDAAIFSKLDHHGEVLFVAAVYAEYYAYGFGGWYDLVDAAKSTHGLYGSALTKFREAFAEAKSKASERVSEEIKTTGRSPQEIALKVADKFHHPDTQQKYGALAKQVTAYLVSEQLAGAK